MKKLPQHYYLWLLLIIIITGFCGLVYGSSQQILRQSANDPQIQMVEDLANQLNQGQRLDTLLPDKKVDLTQSLSPFVIVYDNYQQVIGSSANLDTSTLSLPTGVLDNVKNQGQERLTWQPNSNLRFATIIVKNNNGFVLAARSLREVEQRERKLMLEVMMVWVGLVFVTTIFTIAYPKLIK